MKYGQFLDVAAPHCNLEAPSRQLLPYERTIINYQNSCTQVSVISQAFLHTKIFILSSHQWKAPAVWKTANRLQISLCEEVPNHGYGLWLTNQHRKWRFIIISTTTSKARCCCDLMMPNCCISARPHSGDLSSKATMLNFFSFQNNGHLKKTSRDSSERIWLNEPVKKCLITLLNLSHS